MRILKISLALVLACLLAAPAMAGNIPEFDAVGCDNQNYFALGNFAQFGQVIHNNIWSGGPLNTYSDFPPPYTPDRTDIGDFPYGEFFVTTAGALDYDPCFSQNHLMGYYPFESALTSVWNSGEYYWSIVLQMKPESDINLNIYDCVMKHNEFDLWGFWDDAAAEQTGRYRESSGYIAWVLSANPTISVKAFPGPWATTGFNDGFFMDARMLPTLGLVALDDVLYTSKGLWDEDIVMVMPETLKKNESGEDTFFLKQGDRIEVAVKVPYNNTADVRYGPDSVLLKYIGIVGHYEYGDFCEFPQHGTDGSVIAQ